MSADWAGYNLPAIWQMLATENACTGADRVLAWESLATAVRDQHRRLMAAADELAAVWPPQHNASAKAFLDLIGDLAVSMQQTLACAQDIRVGLHGVVDALGTAQATVRTLAEGRAQVSDDWVPRFVDHAEDEYDQRAQQAMRQAEAAIADHSTQITAPDLFVMAPKLDQGTPLTGGTAGSVVAVRATPIPVPLRHDLVPVHTTPHVDPGAHPGGDPGLGGVVLSGSTPTPAAPGPGTVIVGGSPTDRPAGTAMPAAAAGAAVIGVGGLTTGVLGWGAGAPAAAVSGDIRQAVAVRKALPSGAVIGEGTLSPGGGGGSPLMGSGQRRGRRDDGGASATGVADQSWQAAEGVGPVIVPDGRSVRHDPGPGVLDFGR